MRKFKPYEYEKASIQMSNLISYQQIPFGKKPYSCKKCGKAFSHKPNIIDHEKIHMEEKHFECNECGKDLRSNTSPRITLLTLERNPTNIRNVENPSIR